MAKNEIIAMLLAGGKGSRLESLTKKVAKPAVYFGGKYRIIDFALSNCTNSGINVVGVMTQYESIQINEYIGAGTKWGFDGNNSAAVLLSPRQKETGFNWYNGTADAIYSNIDFMDKYNPEYVLILSADHIYKMNYKKMLDAHKASNADLTIAVLEVPWDEAPRFGIMNTNPDGSVYEFEEKPKNPKSNLASMGIYIFSYDKLKKYLIEDEKVKRDEHDFGKDIIPAMIRDNCKLYAYKFEGYWKDVGTVHSLWQANMDLLESKDLDLYGEDSDWKVYSEDTHSGPQFISKDASVEDSMINQGCVIEGTVKHSVIFGDVTIKKGAVITDAVLLPGVVIEENAIVNRVIINNDIRISANKVVNNDPEKIALISEDM